MAFTSSQRANSFEASSSNTVHHKYDVFLSFRGEDTRGSFLEYLYRALRQKGISTFNNDDKLKNGEDIKDGLLKAIDESSFSILVLSVNYADSSWCLDELVHILQCKRTSGHVVYPVFYHVEPTEVRKIKGGFGEGFAKAASGNEKKVEKWREALSEVANSKGWAYPSTRFEKTCLHQPRDTSPGSKIPEWISYKNVGGSLKFPLPSIHNIDLSKILGFAFSAVFSSNGCHHDFSLHMRIRRVNYYLRDSYKGMDCEDVILFFRPIEFFPNFYEHYTSGTVVDVCFAKDYYFPNKGVDMYYHISETDQVLKPSHAVQECGARLIYDEM